MYKSCGCKGRKCSLACGCRGRCQGVTSTEQEESVPEAPTAPPPSSDVSTPRAGTAPADSSTASAPRPPTTATRCSAVMNAIALLSASMYEAPDTDGAAGGEGIAS
ncbi:unnamed protein product, partial [Pylaiella littoralis]